MALCQISGSQQHGAVLAGVAGTSLQRIDERCQQDFSSDIVCIIYTMMSSYCSMSSKAVQSISTDMYHIRVLPTHWQQYT